MSIDLKILTEERTKLKKDFDDLTGKISTIEKEMITMKNNLNAIYGAIQQTDKLIKLSTSKAKDEQQLLVEKEDEQK
jgi:predicted  nucleic acid-binding Zn-ribbon protein